MNVWICNASPLILLGKLDRLTWLETLSPGFVIPVAVFDEVMAGRPDDPARIWLADPRNPSRTEADAAARPEVLAWDLGAGETAVISGAIAKPGSCAILDDRAARVCARVFGVPVIGTVGILLKAKQAGLVPRIAPDLMRLQEVGSLMSARLLAEALQLAGERV